MMQFVPSLLVLFSAALLYGILHCWLSPTLTNEESQEEALTGTTICIPTVKREPFYLPQVLYSFFHICERYPQVARNIHQVIIFHLDQHHFYPYWNNDPAVPLYCREKISIRYLPPIFYLQTENVSYYHWRSKEAFDYARTMENCERLADKATSLYLLHQDDVVFNSHFPAFYEALPSWMRRSKWQRICSISLYDIKQRTDGGPLLSNNAVSRLYRRNLLKNLSTFIKSHYRKQPVDWLIEEYCRKAHLTTYVKVPNPVDHIGNISTFAKKSLLK